MKETKHKSLLNDLNSSKLKLPNIRKLEIGKITDENKELNSFFQHWAPSKLDLLWVNYPSKTPTGIKMDFYIDSISKAIKSVSREIYLKCFEMEESELEQIIKSAYNWERLIFYYCDIHCSKKLDFSVSEKFKIKFLSFCYCGNIDSIDRKTDWMSTPPSFKNIVEAISKSGLKDSLEQVDIGWNQTLNKDDVQEMFDELEMSHISVVQKITDPMR